MDPERWDDVAAAVQAALAAAGPSLRATRGRKVLEVRPAIDWDKGKALAHLLKALGLDKEEAEGEGEEGGEANAAAAAPPSTSCFSSSPDDDRTVDVVDTWVLERFLGGGPSARWRLAGRLSADVGGGAQERRRRSGVGGFLASLASRKAAAEDK